MSGSPIPATAVVALVLVSLSAVYCASVLQLERAFPPGNHRVGLDLLRARDGLRHSTIRLGVGGGGGGGSGGVGVSGVVDFPVQGSSDPFLVGINGSFLLYFTKVRLGSPPREFNVQIDTGSDILWVNCNSCNDCPQTSGLGIKLNFFDSASSATAGLIACSDPICTSSMQTSSAQCATETNQCVYTFQYGDGSGTSGHYVTDAMLFDMILGQALIVNSSAPIVFGCSTYQSGDLTKTDKAVDGIFGFGPGQLSVISQLSSRGITPRVFSHCLKGDGNGGGILVLGEILEPSIVYSPLVPSQPHYNLDLQSIAVNGQILPIDPVAFATSNNRGTIVDSGTTLAYLVEEAYDPFVSAVTNSVVQSATPMISKGNQCYVVPTSVNDIFPPVTLNFAGGASMVLKPEEYLTHQGFVGGAALWCIGFMKIQGGISILGDLVLKDKIFVYDLAHQRLGWANYDCSMSVNVSITTSRDEYVNAGQLSMSSSSREMFFKMLPIGFVALLLLHTSIFIEFQFL